MEKGPPVVCRRLDRGPLLFMEVVMSDFVLALLDLLFFPFDKVDSVLFMTVFGVFLFCFSFKCIRVLMRAALRR